jgi:manganese transport protein
MACDLAEVIGSAIALNLLFHLPLVAGVLITSLDVLLVLFLQHRGFRWVEIIVLTMVSTVGLCFLYEMLVSGADFGAAARGLVPGAQIIRDPGMLYIAIGILGATVMPHNLYLHSSIVQTRAYERTAEGRAQAVRFATIDSTVALLGAFFINAAILVLSAAAFHGGPHADVADIADAYKLLPQALGVTLASTIFAIALLASGQSSTLTGTLAGQIVMEGFLDLRLRPWVRRLITRLLAVVPAAVVAAVYGERGVGALLILSQVVLSLQLSFAVFPLVMFTSDKLKMGRLVNPRWLSGLAWSAALLIGGLNAWLLLQTVLGWVKGK